MIAVVGDYDPRNRTHLATTAALEALFAVASVEWFATDSVAARRDEIRRASGVLIAPGSPYREGDAVVEVIRTAREDGIPLVGT